MLEVLSNAIGSPILRFYQFIPILTYFYIYFHSRSNLNIIHIFPVPVTVALTSISKLL